jgi:hypothetical protein
MPENRSGGEPERYTLKSIKNCSEMGGKGMDMGNMFIGPALADCSW